jgi:hypothetical protein
MQAHGVKTIIGNGDTHNMCEINDESEKKAKLIASHYSTK